MRALSTTGAEIASEQDLAVARRRVQGALQASGSASLRSVPLAMAVLPGGADMDAQIATEFARKVARECGTVAPELEERPLTTCTATNHRTTKALNLVLLTQTVNLSTETVNLSTDKFNLSTHNLNMSTETFNLSTETFNLPTDTGNVSTETFNLSTETFNLSTETFNLSTEMSNLRTDTFNLSTETYDLSTETFNLQPSLAGSARLSVRCTSPQDLLVLAMKRDVGGCSRALVGSGGWIGPWRGSV